MLRKSIDISAILASCTIAALLFSASPASAEVKFVELKPSAASTHRPLTYIGATAPETLETKGSKLTLVHFWAVWCAPCIEELPQIDKLKAKYPGLKVVTISMDTNADKVRKFFADNKITTLPANIDSGNASFRAAKSNGLPTSVFYDAKSVEIARAEGPLDWKSKPVDEFLRKNLK